MSAPEKGNFSADIGEDVIEEALRSVERRKQPAQDAQPSPEPSAAEAAPDSDSPSAAADAGEDAGVALEFEAPSLADADTAALLADEVARLRAELESTRAQLELSQAKSREMMERVKETHERALRSAADLDNVRKRTAREKEDAQKFANERLLKDFLPVLDNLERALEASASNADVASLRTGVSMTRKQFEDALARHGVKGFSAKGQPFDPRLHEAMQQVETTDVPPGHVAMEMVRGFMLHERLVRPALVVVARAPAPVAAAAEPPVATAPAPGSAEASVETSAPAAGANTDSTSAETAADTAQDSRSGGSA